MNCRHVNKVATGTNTGAACGRGAYEASACAMLDTARDIAHDALRGSVGYPHRVERLARLCEALVALDDMAVKSADPHVLAGIARERDRVRSAAFDEVGIASEPART
jgi:hypothetical protein